MTLNHFTNKKIIFGKRQGIIVVGKDISCFFFFLLYAFEIISYRKCTNLVVQIPPNSLEGI